MSPIHVQITLYNVTFSYKQYMIEYSYEYEISTTQYYFLDN